MRILLVHNRYGSAAPSGENQVFDRECGLLRSAGHEIETLTVTTDELLNAPLTNIVGTALRIPWSPRGTSAIRSAASNFEPAVIHVHNTFPLLSPSIFWAASSLQPRPAVVLTAHNYRMFCAAGNCMRNGALCTRCIDTGSSIHAAIHGCYKGSRLKSLPVAAMISLHDTFGTYKRCVDAIIAQTAFQKDILLRAGFTSNCVMVNPHCVDSHAPPLPWRERERTVVFVGRLSPEKGVDVLLAAWEKMGSAAPQLIVIGGGGMRGEYEQRSREKGLADRIRFLGFVSEEEKWNLMRKSRLLVMPTQWYETFGLVFAEAFAVGVPVLASNLGCIPWVVRDGEDGRLIAPSDPSAWAASVTSLLNDDEALRCMSERCYAKYCAEYSTRGHARNLEKIYTLALRNSASRASGTGFAASLTAD